MARKIKKIPPQAWRADFRDVETLPDIKVIRTGFIYNALALVIALAVVGWIVYDEYENAALRDVHEDIQTEIRGKTRAHKTALQQAGDFTRLQQKFTEIETFSKTPLVADTFLLNLSRVQPAESMLDRLLLTARSQRDGNRELFFHELELTGSIAGSENATESEIIQKFQRSIESLPEIAENLETSTLRNFTRDPALGIFNYRMVFRFKPGAIKTDPPRGRKRD
jgi:hypothetical protein